MRMKRICLLFFIISIIFVLLSVVKASPSSETRCWDVNGKDMCEEINYWHNTKKVWLENITILSPWKINCKWSDPDSNWKSCEVVIEVENKDTIHDFIEKDAPLSKFKHEIENITVYTTKTYNLYNDTIRNETCYNNLTEEERLEADVNKTYCYYNYTRKGFSDWKLKTKLDKVPKAGVLGIKLIFKSPVLADAGKYLINQFNFTLFGDYNITLDPDISACSVLDQAGATYYLTADITDSSTSYCMNISANNITLDCQGHTIDGNDVADYGIYIYRSPQQTTNITVKKCVLSDWDSGNIYLCYAFGNNLTNITSISSPDDGFYIYSSHSNTISNSTATSNKYGFSILSSDSNTISNSTATSNTDYAFYILFSNSNTISNSTATSNTDSGFYIGYSDSNTISNSTATSNKYGFYFIASDSNTISNSTATSNTDYGFELYSSHSNTISSCIADSNTNDGFYIFSSDSNTISNSRIENNTNHGISLNNAGQTGANKIYNNLFNNTVNFDFSGTIYANQWNTTRQTGTRIHSPGAEIGGNYWTNSTGNGYSDTCVDDNKNGFCDDYYELYATGPNRDYLPFSNEYDTEAPQWFDNSTNNTVAGKLTEFRLRWADNHELDSYIFSLDNCTGSFSNITNSSFPTGGTEDWNNEAYVINDTVNCTIRWKVYANDTSNNWNTSDTYSFVTLKSDGSSCSASIECSGGYCVHGICRSSSTYCGDGYCDSGEDCSNCEADCTCDLGYYCSNGQCIRSTGKYVPSPPKQGQLWSTFTPGVAEVMKISDPEIGLVKIEITVKNTANNVKITVTKLEEKPASVVHETSGKVYRYVEINAKNLPDENISEAKIEFQVNKSWIDENNIDPNTIILNRYYHNEWKALATEKIDEDDNFVYYESETPGFTVFTITGEEIVATTIPTTTTTTTLPVEVEPKAKLDILYEYWYTWLIVIVIVLAMFKLKSVNFKNKKKRIREGIV